MASPRFSSLDQWLAWMEQLHPSEIELGLDRIARVAERLQVVKLNATIITVAGTNGKGSCVACLEHCLVAQGKRVGAYTSPHLLKYNERVKIQGIAISDEQLCEAFAAVDEARGDTSLTYFEFGTLAALYIFKSKDIDYCLLEVGLGGRLDAVNVIDPDIAVITSIALDHEAWLGTTREAIAAEKFGILREGIPCVIAEPHVPESGKAAIAHYKVQDYHLNSDFEISQDAKGGTWCTFSGRNLEPQNIVLGEVNLPFPSVGAALQVLYLLNLLPSSELLLKLSREWHLDGRFERRNYNDVELVFDVAHNPAAAQLLAMKLKKNGLGRIAVVLGMMQDKNIEDTLRPIAPLVDQWYVSDFSELPRSASKSQLSQVLKTIDDQVNVKEASTIGEALSLAMSEYKQILVFGSFFTVAEAKEYIA